MFASSAHREASIRRYAGKCYPDISSCVFQDESPRKVAELIFKSIDQIEYNRWHNGFMARMAERKAEAATNDLDWSTRMAAQMAEAPKPVSYEEMARFWMPTEQEAPTLALHQSGAAEQLLARPVASEQPSSEEQQHQKKLVTSQSSPLRRASPAHGEPASSPVDYEELCSLLYDEAIVLALHGDQVLRR